MTGRRRSIATVCLSGALEDKLAAAAHAGFDGVELFAPDLVGSHLSPAQARDLCADLGLGIDLYQPFRDVEGAPPELHARTLRRARHAFDVMAQLGTDTVLVCSSVAPWVIADDDLAAAQLRDLAEEAAARGLRIAYEALAWGSVVSTWEHSWEIVRRADHPALGLCLDSFHVLSRTDDVAGIAGVPGEKIFYLQLADAPSLDMDVLQWSRHHRLFPGQGSFDLPGFVGTVLAAGYAGPLSLEVFNDVFRQSVPALTAVDAMRSLVDLESKVDDGAGLTPAPTRPRPGFVEIEASPGSALRVRAALRALGFARTGVHRSKPVELWEQGTAALLLNTSRPTATPRPDAAITALGVAVEDPAGAARRAEELLAPPLPRVVGAREAQLPAFIAPDGTAVFLCGPDDGPGGWRADFAPVQDTDGATVPAGDVPAAAGEPAPVPARPAAVGLVAVDHVTLTQPFDRSDEATLFFRSVLGLTVRDAAEVSGLFGLVRTTVLGAGDLAVGLNSSVLRRGSWAPGVPAPQSVTFRTDDVFATARALRERGAPLLRIPANYYDDLAARLDVDEGLLAALREHDVMYDRDADGGEYLHLFTRVIGSQVFFEVAQRRGGYRGYGAADAPVRMAAHAAVRTHA
ncbi:sugar phosphate isomerase/epimerase and 4-hydroxyphenylpyruvate domain-containing protein [Georgenia thermotolerans]|uniref:3-dehydroshikimate dehydratase n=1 Tax=Georgenia thermotolerans TaxID=527326 RepID=A0A7J5UNM0_9MICO|nr:sugar phosphate isomerase/epimerase and 4-hydroxyphenylpyruvate domain-containing protein [Georgenia thermotolerans]KAE8763947.1 TIM barrel protein [Georgenia thermotolerans]